MVTVIRELQPGEMEKCLEWIQDDEIARLMPVDPSLVCFAKFAIEVDDQLIGFCHLYNMTPEQAEIGICIGEKSCWGKGYGTEAMRQLIDFCFASGLQRVQLKTLQSNARAIRCYEKCGFTRYGQMSLDGHSFVLMEIYHN